MGGLERNEHSPLLMYPGEIPHRGRTARKAMFLSPLESVARKDGVGWSCSQCFRGNGEMKAGSIIPAPGLLQKGGLGGSRVGGWVQPPPPVVLSF